MTEDSKVADGQVVLMDYALTVDGKVIDQSEKDDPLEFIQGEGQIIPGLEKALYGLAIGDSKNVVVSAADGYGEVDESAFVEVDRDQFGKEIPLEAGVELQVRTDDDNILPARIDKVTDTIVRLDLNHPLACKELRFEVKVVGLREATAEELEHGHVHGADFNDEDFEDEFDDEFDEELEDDEDE